MAAQLKQERHCMLCHIAHAVSNNVAHRNIAGGQRINVYNIIAGGENANHADIAVQLLKICASQRSFVDKHHVCPLGALCNRFGGRGFINGHIAKGCDRTPIHIAEIEHRTVKNGYFHAGNLCCLHCIL